MKTMLATGKAPGPWRKDVLPKLPQAMPIVYLQGLLVQNSDLSIFYEKSLDSSIIDTCITYAVEKGTHKHFQYPQNLSSAACKQY